MASFSSPGQRFSPDCVGRELAPIEWTWGPQQTILYALGVGARLPRDLGLVYECAGPLVLPGFATVPTGIGVMPLIAELGVDAEQLLHGEHSVCLLRPLGPEGSATIRRQVTEVWDKGSAALITLEEHAEDDRGRVLLSARSSWFVRGAGGFGGERAPAKTGANRTAAPARRPERVVLKTTTAEQAALYRLSGDCNPIHIDPHLADAAGFRAPVLHGLCTLGMAAIEVAAELFDAKHDEIRQIRGRFVAPVSPGDTLTIEMWQETLDLARFAVRVDGKLALIDGLISR
jgi:acyl dehydratase